MAYFELTSFANDSELAQAAAAAWLEEAGSANQRGRMQYVALSGGHSARIFVSAVAGLAKSRQSTLDPIHFFWADERCVPPNDAESNFRVAQEFLFSPLKIRPERIHRIRVEQAPQIAARDAQTEICRVAPCGPDGQPVLDLIFLGMGEDGHVASLFPREPEVVRANSAVYRAIENSPKPPANRVTLGYPAIAAARQVWVLVAGAGKATALRNSLDPSGFTPLARVIHSRSHTRIFSDLPAEQVHYRP